LFLFWVFSTGVGVLFSRAFSGGVSRLSCRACLFLWGALCGVYALSARVSPLGSCFRFPYFSRSSVCVLRAACVLSCVCCGGPVFVFLVSLRVSEGDHVVHGVCDLCGDRVSERVFHPCDVPLCVGVFDARIRALFSAVCALCFFALAHIGV
ncbi:hypothetical protein EXIGLDRAFT_609568, partial [Exidia glandulosa HHB12029]